MHILCCFYLNYRKWVEIQHCYFMALKKQMKEKLHIWSVAAQIFLSLIEDHNFKCIYKLYVSDLVHVSLFEAGKN